MNQSEDGNQVNGSRDNRPSVELGLVAPSAVDTYLEFAEIIFPLCAAVCLLACILNIRVNSMQRKDACTCYLLAMSTGDGIYLSCSILAWLGESVWGLTTKEITIISIYINTFLTTTSRNFAIVLNSLASLERFLVLVFPFKVSVNLLNHFPRAVIVFVFGLTVLGHVSLVLEFQVTEVKPNTWAATSSKLRLDNFGIFLFFRNFGRIVFFYIPLLFSLMMNVCLVAALRHHASSQQNIRSTTGHEYNTDNQRPLAQKCRSTRTINKTSRLILILTFSFFILAMPRAINALVTNFVPSYGFGTINHALAVIVFGIADLSAYLSQVSLLVASAILSRQFRKTLFHLLRIDRCLATNSSGGKNLTSINTTVLISTSESCRNRLSKYSEENN